MCVVVLCVLFSAAPCRAQDPQCTKTAKVTQLSNTTTTTPTTHCSNGASCGYLLKYTPPGTDCSGPTDDHRCCKSRTEYTYTQDWVCSATTPSTCVGLTPVHYIGTPITVWITTDCTSGTCTNPPPFISGDF